MSNQTHCIISNNYLHGCGIWCTICAVYMHVISSGLNRGSDHDDNFSCIRCTSLITYNTSTDIQFPSTQRQQALRPNNQNPAMANSNEIVITTPYPWSNPTPDLIDKMRTIYSQVVHWKPIFMILSKTELGSTLKKL